MPVGSFVGVMRCFLAVPFVYMLLEVASMPRFKMIVRSFCPEGIEEQAFNDWYQNTHLADIVRIPGFVAAERLRVAEHVSGDPVPPPYIAIYEIEAATAAEAKQALIEASETGRVNMLEGMDTSGFVATVYEELGERVVR